MQRRNFISESSKMALTTLIAPALLSCKSGSERRQIGLMMNTVDTQMKADYRETLRIVKNMGYTYVEGGVFGDSLQTYAATLHDIGLRAIGHGGALGELVDDYDRYLRIADLLRQEYIICYYPWRVANTEIDLEKSYRTAAELDILGKRLKASGFGFCWHPHHFEFKEVGKGLCPFDIIMRHSDPQHLSLQMDTYWIRRGGIKPLELLKKYPGRTKMFHIKDIGEEDEITCPGDGSIDFKELLDAKASKEIAYLTVEKESKTTDIRCAEKAIAYLKGMV